MQASISNLPLSTFTCTRPRSANTTAAESNQFAVYLIKTRCIAGPAINGWFTVLVPDMVYGTSDQLIEAVHMTTGQLDVLNGGMGVLLGA